MLSFFLVLVLFLCFIFTTILGIFVSRMRCGCEYLNGCQMQASGAIMYLGYLELNFSIVFAKNEMYLDYTVTFGDLSIQYRESICSKYMKKITLDIYLPMS